MRASHPLPALAVTSFAASLTAASGGRPREVARAAAAVAAGQLALGWANDAIDADLDAAAGRTSGPSAKPVAAGRVSAAVVGGAAVAAVVAAVPLSLAAGRRAGTLHLGALAAGLTYDVGLKSTLASPLPYAAFFGALPAVSAAAAGRRAPRLLCAAAGVLGVGAHFANTLKDVDADRTTAVRGLPQVLGPRVSRACAGAFVVVADALVLAGGGSVPPGGRLLLVASAATGAAGAGVGGASAFPAVLAAAGLAVAGVVASVPASHSGAAGLRSECDPSRGAPGYPGEP